jgi:hypothetical protein
MEGVTTAIVAFLFVCVVLPSLVKNKPQYYAALGAILIVILLGGLEAVIDSGPFRALATFMTCLLQALAMILLILSCGGLTWRQFGAEVTQAIDVIRRGESVKEVIVPLRGDEPFLKKKADAPEAPPRTAQPAGESDSSVPLQ